MKMVSSGSHGHGHNHGRSSAISSMTRCGKCCYYCRQVTTFLFSHIGLCALLLGYALIGAFTFQAIESQNERDQRFEMLRTRNEMILQLSNMTNHSIILNRENWTHNAEEILRQFELKLLNAVKKRGYDGSDDLNKANTQWSFSGALLYSIIVITTIGYGNIAPRTDLGKIVTIFYALIGIPLMLFCLSNIGHAMAHSFKFIYWKCCCVLCVKPKKLQRRQRRRRRLIRQQRQRAMMANARNAIPLSVVENGRFTLSNGGVPVAGHHPTQLGPMTAPISRGGQFKFSTACTANGIQSEQTSSSSFSTTPALTPLTGNSSNTQQVFFANNNNNNSIDGTTNAATTANTTTTTTTTAPTTSNNNTLVKPKKSSLARSLSARFHNDHSSLPVSGPKLSAPATAAAAAASTSTTTTTAEGKSTKAKEKNAAVAANVPAVICNRYASLSDDCIDAVYRAQNLPLEGSAALDTMQTQQGAPIQLRYPPRRTPSQVRFMAPPLMAQPKATSAVSALPPPDLNVLSPSPEHGSAQQRSAMHHNQQASLPLPPPFQPYPNGVDGSVPPPPFHPNYYHLADDGSGLYSDPVMIQATAVPPYNIHDTMLLNNNNINTSLKEDFDSDPDADSDSDDDDIAEKNIPITVCMTLVVGYICGGAWFFSNSEDWTFLDASYFCFVTLSTIGFGDLVPGRTVLATTPEEGQMTLAICALYLLFGMGLVAMSLSLIKEKVLETVKIIGERIGILVNDDDDYY